MTKDGWNRFLFIFFLSSLQLIDFQHIKYAASVKIKPSEFFFFNHNQLTRWAFLVKLVAVLGIWVLFTIIFFFLATHGNIQITVNTVKTLNELTQFCFQKMWWKGKLFTLYVFVWCTGAWVNASLSTVKYKSNE